MADTVKDVFIGVKLRVIHCLKDVLEPMVQVFCHAGASVGLTDNQPIIHVAIIAKLHVELVLYFPQLFQLVHHGLGQVHIAYAPLRLGLFKHDHRPRTRIEVGEAVLDLHLRQSFGQLLVHTVDQAVNVQNAAFGVVSVPLRGAHFPAAHAAGKGKLHRAVHDKVIVYVGPVGKLKYLLELRGRERLALFFLVFRRCGVQEGVLAHIFPAHSQIPCTA